MSGPARELLVRGMHALRRSSMWWTIGILALVLITAASWPSLEGSDALDDFEEMGDLLEAFGAQDLTTPAGYLDGQLYALMLPLLLSGMAIAGVSALTSGDEDAGRLEFVHALPVDRRTVWLARLGATVAMLAGVALVAAVAMIAVRPVFSFDEVGVASIAAATGGCAVLAVFHAAVAYAAGGLGASRGRAVGIAVLVLVAGYVLAFLVPLAADLEGVRSWSPWHWAIAEQPVSDGVPAAGVAALVAVTAVLVAVGTAAVDRRDIRSA